MLEKFCLGSKNHQQSGKTIGSEAMLQAIEVGWLFGFHGISTFVGYLTPNPFLTNNEFFFKQLSLAWVHSLIVKFWAIQFSTQFKCKKQ